jgi:hypothetical protein
VVAVKRLAGTAPFGLTMRGSSLLVMENEEDLEGPHHGDERWQGGKTWPDDEREQ